MKSEICKASNDLSHKMSNFQACFNLQCNMTDASNGYVVDTNIPLIKMGPVYKKAKRTGEKQLRHLALVI